MPISDNLAHQQLRNDPRKFLNTYALLIMGDHANGVYNCGISDLGRQVQRPGTFLRKLSTSTTDSFVVGLHASLGGKLFQAHWLKMTEFRDIHDIYAIQPMRLDNTGPDMVFTVMLTGCSVAINDVGGGAIDILHLRPNSTMAGVAAGGAIDGATLNDTLSRVGWTKVYGRNSYKTSRQVSIFGIRRTSGWRIYAQKQAVSLMGTGNIKSVKRIYPL